MELYKAKLIDKHILPYFAKIAKENKYFVDSINSVCRLHKAVKFQELERPGAAQEGRIWFSIMPLSHSFYFSDDEKYRWGSRIWNRQEFIFYSSSLLDQQFRSDYIEVLEPGELLSISYPNLLALMDRYHEVYQKIMQLSASNERHYRYQNQLLNKPAVERVKQLEEENPLFAKVASNSVKAIHVGQTRQGYEKQLKKLAILR
nr:hypothetical protein [Pedobacter panaciterrae]